MLFNRFEFILAFLPLVVLLSYLLPRSLTVLWLVLASLFFYGWSESLSWTILAYALPLVFYSALNYGIVHQISNSENPVRRKVLLWASLIFTVAWWLLLKLNLPEQAGLPAQTVLTVGLGFYTLRTIGYAIDVYQRRLTPVSGFQSYFLYLAFFAHLPSGPITSAKWFFNQLQTHLTVTARPNWMPGFYLFSMGLLKKAIADALGGQINPALDAHAATGLITSWLLLLGYSAQIYLDFAGYTDMALGVGRMIGIQLPPNFASPYLKRNPIEFWNAWHITLSHWLRDYVFTPLGRLLFSFRALKRSPLVIAVLCYLATFILCGVWHGLSETFLLWGLYHGIGLSCCKLYGELARKRFPRGYHNFMFKTRLGYGLATGATFLFVALGWVFFRSHTLTQVATWFKGLLGYYGGGMRLTLVDQNLLISIGTLIVSGALIRLFQWRSEHLTYWRGSS